MRREIDEELRKNVGVLTKGVKLKVFGWEKIQVDEVVLTFTYDFKFMGVKKKDSPMEVRTTS